MRFRIRAASMTEGRSIAGTHHACISDASNARENTGAAVNFSSCDKDCRPTGKQGIFPAEGPAAIIPGGCMTL